MTFTITRVFSDFTVVTLLTLISNSAIAASLYGGSAIKVVTPLNVQEISKLNFGYVATPSSDATVLVDSINGQVSGTAVSIDSSLSSQARFLISGSSVNNIEIKLDYSDNIPHIKFNEAQGVFDGTSGNLLDGINNVNTNQIGKVLDFGAEIQLVQGITEGDYQPEIVLSVNYE